MNSPLLYIEIGQSSFKVLDEDKGLELTLERDENGRLTNICRERIAVGLKSFLKQKNRQTRRRAICAIGARGVSLRHLSLPPSTKEALPGLLRMQIESEFPLAPGELAWGSRRLDSKAQGIPNGTQELMVVAVKEEVVRESSEMLAECGVTATFTLAALARASLCPPSSGNHAVLDIGRSHSELISLGNGAPASIRILSWGGEQITRAIVDQLQISRDEAEKLKISLDQEPTSNGELGQKIQAAMAAALDSLAAQVKKSWTGQKLYLTGRSARHKDIVARLAKSLGNGVTCERLELMPGEGRSAAILGLERSGQKDGGSSVLVLQLNEGKELVSTLRPAPWKWAALAAALVLAVLCLPFAEALVLKPRLAKKLAAIKSDRERLPFIDKELAFLQFMKQSQPPYLDAVYVLANAAPPGARLDSLSMNRHGDLAIRGNMQGSQQVVDFRSKLIATGFFSTVVVEEQTPSPDRQKVTVRMTAQWKPARDRELLKLDPPLPESEKPKGGGKETKPAVVKELENPASTPTKAPAKGKE
jgi:Tfp pilus assembly PilM family ATPase